MFPNQWSLHTRIHDDNTSAGDPPAGRQRRVPDHPVPEDQQHLHRWVRSGGGITVNVSGQLGQQRYNYLVRPDMCAKVNLWPRKNNV